MKYSLMVVCLRRESTSRNLVAKTQYEEQGYDCLLSVACSML